MRKLVFLPAIAAALLASPAHAGTDWTNFNLVPYSLIGQIQRLQMALLTNVIFERSGMSPATFAERGSASNKMNNSVTGWADVSGARIDNSFTVTDYDGDVKAISAGVEQSYSDNLLTGVAISYAKTDLKTTFNGGNHDGKEFTIAPYANYQLNNGLQAGFIFGYAHGSMDMDRYDTFVSRTVTGDTNYDRFFASAKLSGTKDRGQWKFTGSTGLNLAYDSLNSYTDSEGTTFGDDSSTMAQVSLGARAAYKMNAFTPFISATYVNDVNLETTNVGSTQEKPSDGHNALILGGGINLIETPNWSGSISASTELFKSDVDTHSFSLGLKYNF